MAINYFLDSLYFSFEKHGKYWKYSGVVWYNGIRIIFMPTPVPSFQTVTQQIRDKVLTLPQVELDAKAADPTLKPVPDGLIVATWNGHQNTYSVEFTPSSTPKAVETAAARADHARRTAAQSRYSPLVIAPYLSEDRLNSLVNQGISGLDLSGNAALIAPRFMIWRSGSPNRYKASSPIRKVYKGDSSLFARSFLLQNEFDTLKELRSFAYSQFGMWQRPIGDTNKLSLGTASKVVSQLEGDLIVARAGRSIRLIDPDLLLERLKASFVPLRGQARLFKTPMSERETWEALNAQPAKSELRFVSTGLGASGRYRLLGGQQTLSLYVSNLDLTLSVLQAKETNLFPNIELTETTEDVVYFDARNYRSDVSGRSKPSEPGHSGEVWASPIQTWLELASSGPRERDAAQALKESLKNGVAKSL